MKYTELILMFTSVISIAGIFSVYFNKIVFLA